MSASKRVPAPGAPEVAAVVCACGAPEAVPAGEGRKAVAVDPSIKRRNLARLRRIEGQVRGLQRMVDDERYCADILMQVVSVQEALRAVSRELLRNHLTHCVTAAIQRGPEQADAVRDEVVDLFAAHLR